MTEVGDYRFEDHGSWWLRQNPFRLFLGFFEGPFEMTFLCRNQVPYVLKVLFYNLGGVNYLLDMFPFCFENMWLSDISKVWTVS